MSDQFPFQPLAEMSEDLQDKRHFENEFKIERLQMPNIDNKYQVTLNSGEIKIITASCVNEILSQIQKEDVASIKSLKSLDIGVFQKLTPLPHDEM